MRHKSALRGRTTSSRRVGPRGFGCLALVAELAREQGDVRGRLQLDRQSPLLAGDFASDTMSAPDAGILNGRPRW